MKSVYELSKAFKAKYPLTLSFRTAKHAKLVQEYLNPGEKILFAFPAQKSSSVYDIVSSCVVVLTTDRILIGQKRVLFGHFFSAITPDMFNDLKVRSGLIWSTIIVDTVKEVVYLSHIDKHASDEVETAITSYMMTEKKKYASK